MIIHDIEQGTPEWFAVRALKMTASHAQAIGNGGKGLETYIMEMMAEYHSTEKKERFSSADTERGNELEPLARNAYEMEKGLLVEQVGFVELNEYVGCSPDGLVKKEGGTEFKALNDIKHYTLMVNGEKEIESKYIWQCQMNLKITEREWWDLCYFNPNYKTSLITFRILPDEEKFAKLEEGFKKGIELINKFKQIS